MNDKKVSSGTIKILPSVVERVKKVIPFTGQTIAGFINVTLDEKLTQIEKSKKLKK